MAQQERHVLSKRLLMASSPVVFIVFNRPDLTRQVFERIRAARPAILLVVADGPRPEVPTDQERCRQVRAIIEGVDWPCQVLKDYSDINLGCKRRISTGLDWAFNAVDRAIILEDDCLPDLTFFPFCDELLHRYRDDGRVSLITGTNSLFGAGSDLTVYHFAVFGQLWGWASWRRSWKYYDAEMKMWPQMRKAGWLRQLFPHKELQRYWELIFEMTYRGLIQTWDYQLVFSSMVRDGLIVVPGRNLVTNIGFGSDATSTRVKNRFANIPIYPLDFPLDHPSEVLRNPVNELISARNVYFRPILPLMLSILLYRLRRWRLGS